MNMVAEDKKGNYNPPNPHDMPIFQATGANTSDEEAKHDRKMPIVELMLGLFHTYADIGVGHLWFGDPAGGCWEGRYRENLYPPVDTKAHVDFAYLLLPYMFLAIRDLHRYVLMDTGMGIDVGHGVPMPGFAKLGRGGALAHFVLALAARTTILGLGQPPPAVFAPYGWTIDGKRPLTVTFPSSSPDINTQSSAEDSLWLASRPSSGRPKEDWVGINQIERLSGQEWCSTPLQFGMGYYESPQFPPPMASSDYRPPHHHLESLIGVHFRNFGTFECIGDFLRIISQLQVEYRSKENTIGSLDGNEHIFIYSKGVRSFSLPLTDDTNVLKYWTDFLDHDNTDLLVVFNSMANKRTALTITWLTSTLRNHQKSTTFINNKSDREQEFPAETNRTFSKLETKGVWYQLEALAADGGMLVSYLKKCLTAIAPAGIKPG
ncbi:hypothetical protein DFJ58DRAFT_848420 [Suillus subalutaceus]|uniref:uncharacterized protein n=1 Tax=Suillus subalutaceus TaxID=48586 RepID=UPI001B87A775|nr:uncharacterized protein DFJ58DRAFT_848420 [Suillus subalutaceus]KAG1830670.1 hypothetical protein DFJ58DRAFT_848420 [Suillus subalutaceus]